MTLLGGVNDSGLVSLRPFLTRNGHPYRLVAPDRESEMFERLVETYKIGSDDLPAVIHQNEVVLKRPSAREVADRLGLSQPSGRRDIYDVAVTGVGPGGLAAAVNAAAEGLSVIAIEGHAPGGQAGTSSKIENSLRLAGPSPEMTVMDSLLWVWVAATYALSKIADD